MDKETIKALKSIILYYYEDEEKHFEEYEEETAQELQENHIFQDLRKVVRYLESLGECVIHKDC